MELIEKYSTLLLFIFGALVLWITKISSEADQKQKDKIQELINETKKLTENDSIVLAKIEDLTKANKNLSEENLKLSSTTNELVKNIQSLTNQIDLLIDAVDKRTALTEAENRLSGKLTPYKIDITKPLTIYTGLFVDEYEYEDLENGGSISPIMESTDVLVSFEYEKGNVLVSTRVYDRNDQLIAEVNKNVWSQNSNTLWKINYDDFAFEVIDNTGNVAFSIEFYENILIIAGIFGLPGQGRCYYLNNDNMIYYTYDSSKYTDLINRRPILPIFDYNEVGVIGKRARYKDDTI